MERLASAIEHHLEQGVVGIAAAVVAGEEVVWSGGFGPLELGRGEPATTTASFQIQSVTKSLVAAALIQRMDAGAFGLDDPVNRHLQPVTVANPWEESRPITIRQLFTHTAGLPATYGLAGSGSLEDAVTGEIVPVAAPGTAMVYANSGYDVLGCLLERLSGTTWDTAVRDALLLPLGMHATGTAEALGPAPARATGHVHSVVDGGAMAVEPLATTYAAPSGSMVSNVEDLARFLLAMLNGGDGVLSPAAVAEMQRVHASLGTGPGGMGLGFRVDERRGRRFFCHGGDGSGFTTFVGGHPDERVGVVLLMNTGGAQAARSTIVRVALECALGEPPSAARDMAALPAALPAAPGRFRSTFWNVRAEVSMHDGAPKLTVPAGTVSSWESTSRLAPAGARWRAEGGMFDGWELEFTTAADGQPCFAGGVYPFLFTSDASPIIGVPAEVDAGDVAGTWNGTADTPFGPLPLRVDVDVDLGRVALHIMGMASADSSANVGLGWVRGEVGFELPGFGAITLFVRLGLVAGRLEGLLYARTPFGEFAIPSLLVRPGA